MEKSEHHLVTHCSLRSLLVIVTVAYLTLSVAAQAVTSVRVKVTDGSGAVVQGAQVIITNKDTGQTLTATTSEEDLALFSNVCRAPTTSVPLALASHKQTWKA